MSIQAPSRRDPSLCYSIHHPLRHTWLNTASPGGSAFGKRTAGNACSLLMQTNLSPPPCTGSKLAVPSGDAAATLHGLHPSWTACPPCNLGNRGTQTALMERRFASAHKRRCSASLCSVRDQTPLWPLIYTTTVVWSIRMRKWHSKYMGEKKSAEL